MVTGTCRYSRTGPNSGPRYGAIAFPKTMERNRAQPSTGSIGASYCTITHETTAKSSNKLLTKRFSKGCFDGNAKYPVATNIIIREPRKNGKSQATRSFFRPKFLCFRPFFSIQSKLPLTISCLGNVTSFYFTGSPWASQAPPNELQNDRS